jgi:LysR family cyn operon transcriptional activator
MTIDQLKYFIVAAELLNFTEAANRLYVSQPTLSYGINRLEDILQLKLFHHGFNFIQKVCSQIIPTL